MKRLRFHVSVKDLPASIRFYRTLFGAIAWETFHALGRIPVYGEDTAVFNHGESAMPVEEPSAGCCVPAQRAQPASCSAK